MLQSLSESGLRPFLFGGPHRFYPLDERWATREARVHDEVMLTRLFASTRLLVRRPLAQNLYRSVCNGKKERRRSLFRGGNGFVPVHPTDWGVSGELDLVAAPSASQDPVNFAVTNMAFGPDLLEHQLHSRSLCRPMAMDDAWAWIDPNQNVFLPVGDTSRPWQHIQRHLIAKDYLVQQISSGANHSRSCWTGISGFSPIKSTGICDGHPAGKQ